MDFADIAFINNHILSPYLYILIYTGMPWFLEKKSFSFHAC